MIRFALASAALIAPFMLLGCKAGSSNPALGGELAQSDPGVAEPQPGSGLPGTGAGLWDAGLMPTPGTTPQPTDPSIGPSETPTMPTNPGTDPGQGYPAPPGGNPYDNTGSGTSL